MSQPGRPAPSQEEIREQLQIIEDDLVHVRRDAAGLRERVGEEEDPADRGALISAAEEQERLIERLTARKESLESQLEQS